MIPVLYSEKIMVAGPDGDTEITINVHFTWPPAFLPANMSPVIERELHNAIMRIMETAKKGRVT